MPDSVFDKEEGLWIWKFQGNDLFMDLNEIIRIRIKKEVFVDLGPVKEDAEEEANAVVREPPYKILASILRILSIGLLFILEIVLVACTVRIGFCSVFFKMSQQAFHLP